MVRRRQRRQLAGRPPSSSMDIAWAALIHSSPFRKLLKPNWQNRSKDEGCNEKIRGSSRQYWCWKIDPRRDALRAHGLGTVLRAGGREPLPRRFLCGYGQLVVPFPDLL